MDGSDFQHARVSLRTMIGTGYFQTFNTPLIAGREYNDYDLQSSAKVAVVNLEFARRIAGVSNPLGRHFWVEATPYEPQTTYEIVGVVKNTKHHDLREEFQPIMFMPLSPIALARAHERFVIRSSLAPDLVASSLRRMLMEVDPRIRYSFRLLDVGIQESLLRERLMATISSLFGLLAVVLTMAGLYGVISYTVALRTQEIGIRMAIGAGRSSVITLILRESVVVLSLGLIAGCILVFFCGQAVAALLFGLNARDPGTLFLASLVIAIATILAAYLPAHRASRMNPVTALQQNG